jgi:Lsr2
VPTSVGRVGMTAPVRAGRNGDAVAQKVQVVLTDDLDGGRADETVQFALDGATYEIDLSQANAEALREALTRYVSAARRTGGRVVRRAAGGKSRPAAERVDLSDVRAWARENGFQVSDRGRVSGEVRAAYDAAHP